MAPLNIRLLLLWSHHPGSPAIEEVVRHANGSSFNSLMEGGRALKCLKLLKKLELLACRLWKTLSAQSLEGCAVL